MVQVEVPTRSTWQDMIALNRMRSRWFYFPHHQSTESKQPRSSGCRWQITPLRGFVSQPQKDIYHQPTAAFLVATAVHSSRPIVGAHRKRQPLSVLILINGKHAIMALTAFIGVAVSGLERRTLNCRAIEVGVVRVERRGSRGATALYKGRPAVTRGGNGWWECR